MARSTFIFFVCILFAIAYATHAEDSSTTRCQKPNEVYECRYEYEWENCEDRYNSPPFNPGKPNQCRCYCVRGTWRNPQGQCVQPEQCPPINY